MNEDITLIKQQRLQDLERDFVAPEPTVAGRKLFPFSAGRKLLLRALKNELLSGKDLSSMEDPDFAVLEFLYLHSLASDEATKAVYGNRDFWRDCVIEFACQCSASMDEEVLAVMAVLKQAQLADVEVHHKPQQHGSSSNAEPPPNS